jgi:hypothetical protein
MKLIPAILCILPILISCKSTHFTPKNYTRDQIVVGSSGGVTGMMKEYVLLDNCQLFLNKGITGEWRELGNLKKSTTKNVFKKAAELGLGSMNFKHPGNMTYYLILKKPPRSNEIKWGESGIPPPDGLREFYDYLLAIF